MLQTPEARLTGIHELLVGADARRRLANAYYEILSDAFAFGPLDLPEPRDRDWIRGATALPIQHATDAALAAIAVELDQALRDAPDDLLRRLTESRR